eukprot:scaffold2372_cov68-Skeletonema_marinoi.AAC.1
MDALGDTLGDALGLHKNGSIAVTTPGPCSFPSELKVTLPAERIAVTSNASVNLKTISLSLTKSTSVKVKQPIGRLANSALPIMVPTSDASMEDWKE